MAGSGELIFAWLRVLDELSYYELFGIPSEATADEVRQGFHEFCDTFHPDRHIARGAEERQALSTIFKRGTEAYLVLSDPSLRVHYDTQLSATLQGRPQRMSFSPLSRPPSNRPPAMPITLEEAARSPAARAFARRAEELIGKGDLKQAKLQLVLANHRDPENPVLEAALRDVETQLEARPKWPS